MSSCTDEDIAARASLEEARASTNALLARCSDFAAPSGEFGPLQVAIIPGAGRCFYDAVLHQLAESGGAGLVAHADVLALSMLEALSTCRDDFEEMLAISEKSDEVQLLQRKSYVQQKDVYIAWRDRLTDLIIISWTKPKRCCVRSQCWTLGSMSTRTKCGRGRNLLETCA